MIINFTVSVGRSLTIFFALIHMLTGNSAAQSSYIAEHYNTSNGFPQNNITGMAFDKAGYLWVGTSQGLVRYDGNSFKSYLPVHDTTGNIYQNIIIDVSGTLADTLLLIRMRNGLIYTIRNQHPVLFSDAEIDNKGNPSFDGYFPNLDLFKKYNRLQPALAENFKWNTNMRAVLPLNNSDFIVLGENEKTFIYYQDVNFREVKTEANFLQFLKLGKFNLMLDEKMNFHLFDSSTGKFSHVAFEFPALNQQNGESPGISFLWDEHNNESYCFTGNKCFQLDFDTISRQVKTIPRFSVSGEQRVFSSIIYDPVNTTYFLGTFNDGLFRLKLKRTQVFSFSEQPDADMKRNKGIDYALLKTSDSSVMTASGLEFVQRTDGSFSSRKKGNIFSNKETIASLGDTAFLCVQQNQLVYYSRSDGFKEPRSFNEDFNRSYNSFITLLYPEGDSVWVCGDAGIYSVRKNSVQLILQRPHDRQSLYFGPRFFFRLSPEEALFSNSFGLFKLKTSFPYTVDSFPQLKDQQVRSCVKTKDGIIMAVYKFGLMVWKNNKFYRVSLQDDQQELSFCHSLYLDKNDNVWVATEGGGLNFVDRKTGVTTWFKHDSKKTTSIGSSYVRFIYKDKEGDLWAGTTSGGLNLVHPESGTFTRFIYDPANLPTSKRQITVAFEDSRKRFWVGTQLGLKLFRKSNHLLLPDTTELVSGEISSAYIFTILEDSKNNVWVSTNRGLFFLEKSVNVFRIVREIEQYVDCLYEDRKNRLWIGIRNAGLIEYELATGKMNRHAIADGMPGNQVLSIQEDQNNNLWLATDIGLVRYNLTDKTVRLFDTGDGIMVGGSVKNSTYKSETGELFFGGRNALVSFFPDKIKHSSILPPLVFTSLKLLNRRNEIMPGSKFLEKDISLTNKVALAYDEAKFTITFALLSYVKPLENTYAYKMDGIDEGWNFSKNNFITYTGLPPGSYTLFVKGADCNGTWSEPIKMEIEVAFPWWRRWWAWTGYLLCFAFIQLIIIRYSSRRGRNAS